MATKRKNEFDVRQQLAELPGRNKKCDVIIEVGDHSFVARKDVLILRMEHFRKLFTAEMQEKSKVIIPLDPTIVDPNVFDEILDYIYTFDITFTHENLESIYKAAVHFGFTELKAKAEAFMKENINMNNISLFMQLAIKYKMQDQQEDCMRFIMSNPPSAFDTKTRHLVGYLTFQEMGTLLKKLANSSKFENMFHLSMEWIQHDEKNRSEKTLELLKLIPLWCLSLDFYKTVILKNKVVMNNNKCLQLVFKSVIRNSPNWITQPLEELYVLGGKNRVNILSLLSRYDSSSRQWVELPIMPRALTHFACTAIDYHIYLCGGSCGTTNSNELLVFDTNSQMWTHRPPMMYARQSCAMAVLDDYLYVAGGWDYKDNLGTVERFSLRTELWETAPPMNHKRNGLELVEMNGYLYAIGGIGSGKTVERYNPDVREWKFVASPNNLYSFFGAAVFNNRIYIVGLNCCEEYNPEEDKWQVIPGPTRTERTQRLAVFDGKLYAIGGQVGDLNHWAGTTKVEYFDPDHRTWIAAKEMNVPRCFHSVAVVQKRYTPEFKFEPPKAPIDATPVITIKEEIL